MTGRKIKSPKGSTASKRKMVREAIKKVKARNDEKSN